MSAFRKLKTLVLGQYIDMEKTQADLEAAGVPTSHADCRICPDPCDEGHEEWPKKFMVDHLTQLLGNVKPYNRQLVISTGRKDWAHDISEEEGSLAVYLDKARDALPSTYTPKSAVGPTIQGVFPSASSSRIAILNGSHRSISDDDADQTVLVFPDYTFVTNVKTSLDGAKEFWKHSVDPSLEHGGAFGPAESLQTKILPYSCVILLCSHKKRDNRCAIAAPKLEAAFTHSLHGHQWSVDVNLDESMFHDQAPLESFEGTPEERNIEVVSRLKQAAEGTLGHEKKALIVYNSHMGGHKFAGNVIIYTPTGCSIWYGRVSTHEVESVVANTIIGGKVLPPLLRGGVNIQRPGCSSLHDW